MIWLLDTNIVIALMRPSGHARARTEFRRRPPGSVVTSVIVAHELFFGADHGAQAARNRRRLDVIFAEMPPLPFTVSDADTAAQIRTRLKAKGTPIGPYDTLIAGQALARGACLVTNNIREFTRVDGLVLEDWTADRPS